MCERNRMHTYRYVVCSIRTKIEAHGEEKFWERKSKIYPTRRRQKTVLEMVGQGCDSTESK